METIGLPKLTPEQKENLLIMAEKAARDYIKSKIPQNKITTLNIIVEIEGEKTVTVTIDIELTLTPQTKNHNTQQIANEATKKALAATDKYLRETACKSTK